MVIVTETKVTMSYKEYKALKDRLAILIDKNSELDYCNATLGEDLWAKDQFIAELQSKLAQLKVTLEEEKEKSILLSSLQDQLESQKQEIGKLRAKILDIKGTIVSMTQIDD
jgi:septal ring factor EnvC (AmiA/AmiB activator)